jgi:5-amino-6-(5-phosphoribosylamino)uracil reductase
MDAVMNARPYVVLSCAMSLDSRIDDTSEQRLILSNIQDLDRVDEVRASSDAILIGANTIRRDNPRLLVNSADRRARRSSRGLPAYPVKVTVTSAGLDPECKFFNTGGEKLVYCPETALDKVSGTLESVATIVGLPSPINFGDLLDDLGKRQVGRLMVEGGSAIHTQFLEQDIADELQLAVAPFFVGQADAPRFVNPGVFPQNATRRMVLEEIRKIGDVVLMRYLCKAQ